LNTVYVYTVHGGRPFFAVQEISVNSVVTCLSVRGVWVVSLRVTYGKVQVSRVHCGDLNMLHSIAREINLSARFPPSAFARCAWFEVGARVIISLLGGIFDLFW